jgi:hypothetical protein
MILCDVGSGFRLTDLITDFPPPHPRRHLLRLWLATPESEGGWALPFHDSDEKKRGGIQVNNKPPICPLDAE